TLKGRDAAWISFTGPSPTRLTYFHSIDPSQAIAYCRKWNDALAKLCARHGDRLAAVATRPRQDSVGAAAELSRAVTELGLVGGAIGTDFGRSMESRDLDVLYEAAC